MGTIVVGVDGSAGSDAALRWALDEARLRGSRVRVVHSYEIPHDSFAEVGAPGLLAPPVAAGDIDRLRENAEAQARAVVESAVQRAGDAAEGLEIEHAPLAGQATETLIEAGRNAELLVLGSRGRGGFLGLLLGSVSQQLASHAPCPVVILPPAGQSESG
jgi:nucleotide-binding universal stress UspA family protein